VPLGGRAHVRHSLLDTSPLHTDTQTDRQCASLLTQYTYKHSRENLAIDDVLPLKAA